MKRTENLNLPIYDNPESDIFKINDVNNAHETIDKQYKEKLLNSFDERFKNEMDELKSRIRVNDSTVKENEANAKRAIQEANQLILDKPFANTSKDLTWVNLLSFLLFLVQFRFGIFSL